MSTSEFICNAASDWLLGAVTTTGALKKKARLGRKKMARLRPDSSLGMNEEHEKEQRQQTETETLHERMGREE